MLSQRLEGKAELQPLNCFLLTALKGSGLLSHSSCEHDDPIHWALRQRRPHGIKSLDSYVLGPSFSACSSARRFLPPRDIGLQQY
jgi:hypothetical protein